VDSALNRIEHRLLSREGDFECLVIIVGAGLTFWHRIFRLNDFQDFKIERGKPDAGGVLPARTRSHHSWHAASRRNTKTSFELS
jgi:hypothetical protein